MNKLPFLKEHSWPKRAKSAGESLYGFSETEELLENAAKELIESIGKKDFPRIAEAIEALVYLIKNKNEDSHEDDDAFENP